MIPHHVRHGILRILLGHRRPHVERLGPGGEVDVRNRTRFVIMWSERLRAYPPYGMIVLVTDPEFVGCGDAGFVAGAVLDDTDTANVGIAVGVGDGVDAENGWVDWFCPATFWVGGAVYDRAVGKHSVFFGRERAPGYYYQPVWERRVGSTYTGGSSGGAACGGGGEGEESVKAKQHARRDMVMQENFIVNAWKNWTLLTRSRLKSGYDELGWERGLKGHLYAEKSYCFFNLHVSHAMKQVVKPGRIALMSHQEVETHQLHR